MTEDEIIKSEMRLYALEAFVVNACAIACLQLANPREIVAKIRQQMIEGARMHGFPVDPAISDHLSAELESALDRLASMVNAQIDLTLKAQEAKNPDGS